MYMSSINELKSNGVKSNSKEWRHFKGPEIYKMFHSSMDKPA